jgi:mono/diheme cytochrome c family protein
MIERFLRKYTPVWSPMMFKVTMVTMILGACFIPVMIAGIPWVEFVNDMAAQPKGKTQMTYGRVYGKQLRVGRTPIPGTVPRNKTVTYPYEDEGSELPPVAKKTDKFKRELAIAKQVGEKYHNPLRPTVTLMEHGRRNFNIYCKTCHGNRATGDGPATGANRVPRPPSLHTDAARAYQDGTLFHIATKGVGRMPGYRDKLSVNERWEVILYVRALQRAMHPEKGDVK